MNKLRYFFIILFFCSAVVSYGQPTNFNKVQVLGSFGHSIYSDFANKLVDTFKNGNFYNSNVFFHFGSSNICDSNGRLLLVCNGMTLYDSNGNVVQGGAQLVSDSFYYKRQGFSSMTQGTIILPMGGDIYYLIVTNITNPLVNKFFDNSYLHITGADELLLYKVDIKANSGLPKVIDTISLVQNGKLDGFRMMAVKSNSGDAWWLIKATRDSSTSFQNGLPVPKNEYIRFYLRNDSISPPIYKDFPNTYMGYSPFVGQAMFNCEGTQFAATNRSLNKIFIADFNRQNGVFSNPQFIDVPDTSDWNPNVIGGGIDSFTHGVCFSPNGRFIYVARRSNIYQYDLLANNEQSEWEWIYGLDTVHYFFAGYSNIYTGPDNKLYIGYFSSSLNAFSYINYPNSKGQACDFKRRGLRSRYSATFNATFNNFPCMPHYDMDLVPCDTTTNPNPPPNPNGLSMYLKNGSLLLYPNPTQGIVHLKYDLPQDGILRIHDLTGRTVKQLTLAKESNYAHTQLQEASGLYTWQVLIDGQTVKIGKLVVE